MQPKTPKRNRARSDTKTPLTPSLISALNNFSLVPSSPVKRSNATLSDSLHRQASVGVIRKGGVESRLDVVTHDYVPPQKPEVKRSRSTPAVVSNTPSTKNNPNSILRIA